MTKKLTTKAGQPWANNEHSQTAGVRGPVLMQDYQLLEKLAHFNRERIPERVVHAKGAGAKGVFKLTHDMSKYTKADLFNGVGKETPMAARFSQVAGEAGYPDTIRDVRGYALKFYTRDGNYDIVGNNTPVFFINDPLKFPDFIHSQKRDPQTHMRDDEMQWDFWSHSPESVHQVTYLMGDRGNPASYRNMNGYGSHTYKWVNKDGEAVWVKYHFISQQGVKNMTDEVAAKAASEDTDYLLHDLYDAIKNHNYPTWKVCVQIIPYQAGLDYHDDIFDVTKVVSHHDYPLQEVGEFTLNESPTNYFDEVEEIAFSPANLVPGIEASPDKLLQGRLFGYKDAQRYRLGANFEQLEVNRPKNEVHTYERDGAMADHQGNGVNYEPNSKGGPVEDPNVAVKPAQLHGETGTYKPYDQDFYTQAGDLYRLYSKEEQDRLIATIKKGLGSVDNHEIQVLETRQFYQADPDYGTRVADALGLDLDEIKN
ncbi:catalase [Fructilactobacillus lindneri]|uniref:Catalase n=1 Tax=Fructilactobacillus lindneri DSM 20690 = JCM 11027 TaxID=1122148 RepID=A0A0R2JV41_9LACO|nr:catalase [Fructilactobacillus lindneri]KRN78228.1 catalase [Fructilactobacillus lindneri DSM 20690 = JCM 11027]POH05847.1 catalase [Fructilactobacillus lindneri]POH06037.1 catalase [Fructilactobacillus lindneri]POH23571.1 catalase [Fructilactobacillus lindneri DSM 20690 = JCM 11027]SJZ95513.1 catalase [Fructilactobacillus lindneri DSM 20690 = JCM 11027]